MPRLLLLGIVLALAGCGGRSAAPTATAVSTKTYSDPTYNFSFKYPANWKAPKTGQPLAHTNSYVVKLFTPGNAAGAEVLVTGTVTPFPTFNDGLVVPDPAGGSDTLHYFHATVDGLPAMHIERFSGKHADQISTIVNQGHREYVVRILTGQPPFSPQILQGYGTIVKTLKVPFS